MEERQQRRIAWRLSGTRLPKIKTMEEFDFNASTSPYADTRTCRWRLSGRAEPVIFLGETGTGKTHLMTALCVEACRQNKRVRFTTVAALINELVEASNNSQLSRSLSRWKKWDLIALDEMGYVPLAEAGAELLFQVIADREDKAAVIVTTNLPFSEWSSVSPTPAFARHCWTASPTALTSSRPEPSHTASVAPWNERRKPNQGGPDFADVLLLLRYAPEKQNEQHQLIPRWGHYSPTEWGQVSLTEAGNALADDIAHRKEPRGRSGRHPP